MSRLVFDNAETLAIDLEGHVTPRTQSVGIAKLAAAAAGRVIKALGRRQVCACVSVCGIRSKFRFVLDIYGIYMYLHIFICVCTL